MKNFYDITAIKTADALKVDLQYCVHGRCVFTVLVNDRSQDEQSRLSLDLFDTVTVKVELTEFDEGVSGVEIKKLAINGIELLPKYQHLSSNKKCYIDQVGIWRFDVPGPFYVWYHQISGQGWIA